MQSKLGLDFKKVEHAKQLAKEIANEVQAFVESKTTVAVERTLCRLMGIDGVDENQVPLPNVIVDDLKSKGVLGEGALFIHKTGDIGTMLGDTGIVYAENGKKYITPLFLVLLVIEFSDVIFAVDSVPAISLAIPEIILSKVSFDITIY